MSVTHAQYASTKAAERIAAITEWAKRQPEPFDVEECRARFSLRTEYTRALIRQLLGSGALTLAGEGDRGQALYRRAT